MILKITSGLPKKQKFIIIGFVLVITLSLVVSYLINQNTKPSKAKSPNQITVISSISSVSIDLKSSTNTSSSSILSSLSSSSSTIQSSSSSETPKPAEEKPKEEPKKEEIKPEQIIEKITKIDSPVVVELELAKPIPVKIPEPVYVPPAPKVEAPQPKIDVPAPEPEPVYVPPPTPELPKPTLSFSSNTCDQSMVYELLSLVNNHRLANDLGTVALAGDLNNVACSHAQWMNETSNFSHTGKDGTNPYQRCQRAGTVCWAENVAYSTAPSTYGMFEMYKNSPGHNKNMLNPDYSEIGLAFGGIYNAQVFR
jgi:uncharacterized protein YkwD